MGLHSWWSRRPPSLGGITSGIGPMEGRPWFAKGLRQCLARDRGSRPVPPPPHPPSLARVGAPLQVSPSVPSHRSERVVTLGRVVLVGSGGMLRDRWEKGGDPSGLRGKRRDRGGLGKRTGFTKSGSQSKSRSQWKGNATLKW